MPNFGKETNGQSSTGSGADRKKVSSASPSTSGTVTSATIRVWVSGGTSNVKAVIYADSAGVPGALLAISDEVAITSTTEIETTLNFTGGNQVVVTGGTTYWIGWHHSDPGGLELVHISRDADASASQTNIDTYSDGPTDPFGTPTAEAGPIDCYVTYTESANTSVPYVATSGSMII